MNNMRKMSVCLIVLYTLLMAFTNASCNDDENKNEPKIENQTPKEQWGKTLKGDGEILGAYPDLFVNYWAYAYQVDEHPDIALCIRGQYPHARYFSLSLYNDLNGDVVGGIDDANIEPDPGSVNPFVQTSKKANYFTVYVVPSTMSEDLIAQLPSKNICRVTEGIEKVSLCIREYLGTNAAGEKDEFGGVELPAITAYDINTLKEVKAPDHMDSNVDKITGTGMTLKSDESRDMPFFLAPVSAYYPNNSTDYLYARTHLQKDSVLTFSFIPATHPRRPEEYKDADTRFWSICLGAASNTRSYYSVLDAEANYTINEKASFIITLKSNPKLADVQAKVKALNDAGKHCNLMVWDSEKLDLNNAPIGEYIVVMYRNILPNKNWEHSISHMVATDYKDDNGEPIDKVTDPSKQIAHIALGDYGPYGMKYSADEFIGF